MDSGLRCEMNHTVHWSLKSHGTAGHGIVKAGQASGHVHGTGRKSRAAIMRHVMWILTCQGHCFGAEVEITYDVV